MATYQILSPGIYLYPTRIQVHPVKDPSRSADLFLVSRSKLLHKKISQVVNIPTSIRFEYYDISTDFSTPGVIGGSDAYSVTIVCTPSKVRMPKDEWFEGTYEIRIKSKHKGLADIIDVVDDTFRTWFIKYEKAKILESGKSLMQYKEKPTDKEIYDNIIKKLEGGE